jgi:pimeloyl-ACP methyl ester carboxylesterase
MCIAALIDYLGLDSPDLVGYSLGGGVALHAAAKHAANVGRLVAASANIRLDERWRGPSQIRALARAARSTSSWLPYCSAHARTYGSVRSQLMQI